MSRPSWLQRVYWNRFAKPVEERALFKFLMDYPIASILEIGVGSGARMKRIAELVSLTPGAETLRYIGVDEFEAAQDGRAHMSLKQAHQLATRLGFKASLIPGTHASALPRVAHKMGASDLILIDGGYNAENPQASVIGQWLDRLGHDQTAVIATAEIGGTLELVDRSKIRFPIRAAA